MVSWKSLFICCISSCFTGIKASVADEHPLWNYDWTNVIHLKEWLFLLSPRLWEWIYFECPDSCCNASCDTRDPTSFEGCVYNMDATCRLNAAARIPIRKEDYLCLIRNPPYGDYDYDGSYFGYQLEWDVSWLPLGADPTWMQWNHIVNDCMQGSIYLRNTDADKGKCKAEMAVDEREQVVTSDSIGVFYEGQMSNAYGMTRAMMMIACHSITVNWKTIDAWYYFNVSTMGLKGMITPITRPTTTEPPLTSVDEISKTADDGSTAEAETEPNNGGRSDFAAELTHGPSVAAVLTALSLFFAA